MELNGNTHIVTYGIAKNTTTEPRSDVLTLRQNDTGKELLVPVAQKRPIFITGKVTRDNVDVNHSNYNYSFTCSEPLNYTIYIAFFYISGGYCQVSAYVKINAGERTASGTVQGWHEANVTFSQIYFNSSQTIPQNGECGYNRSDSCFNVDGIVKTN